MKKVFLNCQIIIIFTMHCFCTLSIIGCGKKGDPLPPFVSMPQHLTELKYSIDNLKETALLQWNYSPIVDSTVNEGISNKLKPNGVEIFRATVNRSGDFCKGCPLEFDRVASVPYPVSEYKTSIKKGFIYFYKLRSFTDNNISSQFSETIEFEF